MNDNNNSNEKGFCLISHRNIDIIRSEIFRQINDLQKENERLREAIILNEQKIASANAIIEAVKFITDKGTNISDNDYLSMIQHSISTNNREDQANSPHIIAEIDSVVIDEHT